MHVPVYESEKPVKMNKKNADLEKLLSFYVSSVFISQRNMTRLSASSGFPLR